ncbi:hypothetical protein P3S68_016988 [Capsicum galapagoense]
MEEEMMRGLQQLGWKKVDVSFHSAFWPFFAHSNIYNLVTSQVMDLVLSMITAPQRRTLLLRKHLSLPQKQDSSDESSSDDDEPVAGQPKTVKNTSDSFEETNSDEDNSDSDSGADKGKAGKVSNSYFDFYEL